MPRADGANSVVGSTVWAQLSASGHLVSPTSIPGLPPCAFPEPGSILCFLDWINEPVLPSEQVSERSLDLHGTCDPVNFYDRSGALG